MNFDAFMAPSPGPVSTRTQNWKILAQIGPVFGKQVKAKVAGRAVRDPDRACYHTDLYTLTQDGIQLGIVLCAVGAFFAVLIAEQLFASGCRLLISITSSGQLVELRPPPYFVLIERALGMKSRVITVYCCASQNGALITFLSLLNPVPRKFVSYTRLDEFGRGDIRIAVDALSYFGHTAP